MSTRVEYAQARARILSKIQLILDPKAAKQAAILRLETTDLVGPEVGICMRGCIGGNLSAS